jgi:hypothetical protein
MYKNFLISQIIVTGVTRKRSIYPQIYRFISVFNQHIWGECVTSV